MKKISYVILTIVAAIFLIIGSARKAPAQQAPTSSIQGFTWSDLINDGIQTLPSTNTPSTTAMEHKSVSQFSETKCSNVVRYEGFYSNFVDMKNYSNPDDISVNYITYKPLARMFASKGLSVRVTCRANSANSSKLKLLIGVPDNTSANNPFMTINIRQGKELKYSKKATSGSLIETTLDLENDMYQSSFSVELNCHKSKRVRSGCIIYFLEKY